MGLALANHSLSTAVTDDVSAGAAIDLAHTVCVVVLDLKHVAREKEHPDPDGDEGYADDEESGEHRAGSQDGLPGGQPLLLEGAI